MHTLDQLNVMSLDDSVAALDGVYEHAPWVSKAAAAQRPFAKGLPAETAQAYPKPAPPDNSGAITFVSQCLRVNTDPTNGTNFQPGVRR